ncbi:MAG: hypothetical protein HN404_11985 [Gemmatimonadetes bacterium]|nr:hypothetical protein [Gemmatimonadota bacterium]
MSWHFLHVCDLQPGSHRSFRCNPRYIENGRTAYRQLQGMGDADLLLVGGDLTRDGSIHDFELEEARAQLDALPYPHYAIPGNMDSGNKYAPRPGGTGRDDPALMMEAAQLDNFSRYFGEMPWSFAHKDVRFSGFYAAVAGTGFPHEQRMWQWLEEELPSLPPAKHHVMTMHYMLFFDRPEEPTWDLMKEEEYYRWYSTIDEPHRSRMLEAFKRAKVEIVLSGHIHCRRPEQVVDGIRFYRAAGIAMPQQPNAWPNADPRLGFYRFDVEEEGIRDTFIPLDHESTAEGNYGLGGHPPAETRDYTIALEKPPEDLLAGKTWLGGGVDA